MPALAAIVSVNPTVMLPGQGGTIQLVINNTSATAATITNIQSILSGNNAANAPINMGIPPYGQGQLTSVPSNGSVQLNYGIMPYGREMRYTGGSPASLANPGNYNIDTNPANVDTPTYTVGALIQTSDGIISTAQTQNIQVVNTNAALPVTPLNGQVRFDSSFNSDFLGVL